MSSTARQNAYLRVEGVRERASKPARAHTWARPPGSKQRTDAKSALNSTRVRGAYPPHCPKWLCAAPLAVPVVVVGVVVDTVPEAMVRVMTLMLTAGAL